MPKAPEPTKLFNIEQWYTPSLLKVVESNPTIFNTTNVVITTTKLKDRKIEVIEYGKPYPLAKSIKRMEELKNYPRGTYFKLVKH